MHSGQETFTLTHEVDGLTAGECEFRIHSENARASQFVAVSIDRID